jgi:hypothetical protein
VRLVRVEEGLYLRVQASAKRNFRPLTSEVALALERHLAAEGEEGGLGVAASPLRPPQ